MLRIRRSTDEVHRRRPSTGARRRRSAYRTPSSSIETVGRQQLASTSEIRLVNEHFAPAAERP